MTFDEQLERALDTLTGRLRDEVTRQVRLAGDELAAAAPRPEPTPVDQGAATGRLAESVRAIGEARSLSEILDALTNAAGQEAARAGVLLVRGDDFRGWRFVGFDASFNHPADIDRLPSGMDAIVLPIAIAGQKVAVLYADAGSNPEPGTANLEPGTLNAEPLEILSRFASRCLESLTAIKAARTLVVPSDSPTPAPAAHDDEEDVAAKRYARLLVSEIKLYHEEQVAAGRRERDLAARLGGEIARARALYEQRVPNEVRQRTDYIHEELIRTLADGDASLLEAKV